MIDDHLSWCKHGDEICKTSAALYLETSPRISNRMVNNVSVPCTEIMGTHL